MHLDARLEVVPGRVAAGNSLDFVIHNTGTDDLLAGRRYWLERFNGEHWVEVRWYTNWTLEAYSISPGDAWTQRTRVPADVSPGSFRVIKTLAALVDEDDCLYEEVTASGAFEVVELR